MIKNYVKVMVILCIGTMLIGCAARKPLTMFSPYDMNAEMKAGKYVPKVDDFLIIFDASGTMGRSYMGTDKFNYAREIVNRMNQTIPDMALEGGLRTFGGSYCPFGSKSRLIYGMTAYSEQGLGDALQTVKRPFGGSPLAKALYAAGKDLESASGKSAIIIVSDGKEMTNAPVTAAETIKSQFGDKLCIYTVLVGDDPRGKSLLEQVAAASQCGFSVAADQIYSSGNMADFVEKVFFDKLLDSDGDGVTDDLDRCPDTPKGVDVDEQGCPLDTDGDGVYDYRDQCPNTPKGVQVDAKGCPLDSDGDGVYDYLDQCPGTPKGAKVDSRGCWVLDIVMFDTDKSTIKPQFSDKLDEVAVVLENNPGMNISVQGHTDNVGPEAYNQYLSENRAKSVVEYLVKKGIDRGRLAPVGHGLSKPIASNDTKEGRAKNRRVELAPVR